MGAEAGRGQVDRYWHTLLGAGWAWASAVLPVLRASAQLDTGAGATEIRNAATSIVADSGASGVGANVRGPCSRRCLLGDQLVQLSVAGWSWLLRHHRWR